MCLLSLKYRLAFAVLWLSSCDNDPQIDFAQPFPASEPTLKVFPARHQGIYTLASDSTYRLVIKPRAIWAENLWTGCRGTRREIDSLGLSTANQYLQKWQAVPDGQRFRLRQITADSVWFDMWTRDTLCALGIIPTKQVRWFRGSYYLCESITNGRRAYWNTERLKLDGRHLSWQKLGSDTLRIAVLPPGVVRRDTAGGSVFWSLRLATRRQERQIANYEGLWTLCRELDRQ